jgi:hypothetical protein
MRLPSNLLSKRCGLAITLLILLTIAPSAYAAEQPFIVTSSLNSSPPFTLTLPSTLSQ